MRKIERRTMLGMMMAGAAAPAVIPSYARAAGVSDREIVIGTHLDLSGPAAFAMPPLRNAIQMRVDELNEAGGVNGRRIRLIVEDNASQPQQAVRAVDKLIRRDEIFAMVCPFGSGPNAATVRRVVGANTICFAPYAASAIVQQTSGNSPLLFTTVPHYDTTTAAGLKWAFAQLGSKRVGLILQEGPFGDLVAKGAKAALAQAGLQAAAEASYKVGDIDFSSQVARMRAANVDLIVTATVVRETIGIAAEVKKLGWDNVNVLSATPGRTAMAANLGKGAMEGVYGLGSWKILYPEDFPQDVKSWADSYRKRFNSEPDEIAMVFYDYTNWFFAGVQAVGRSVSSESVAAALAAVGQKGLALYDTQRFVSNHAAPEWTRVERVKDGKWIPVSDLFDPAK